MAQFFPLTVTDIAHTTSDSVVVTLMPREEDRERFLFTQGQYLTFRRWFDGVDVRRSYSICSARREASLRVGIRQVAGGVFSNWANEYLAVGDCLEAMPPQGRFFTELDEKAEKHYLGFAGGAGITPLLSLITTTLQEEPSARFTLIYANRQVNKVMFREELEALKNTYMARFSLVHILESGMKDLPLFSGRIDAEKCAGLFQGWIDLPSIDTVYICGPEPMMRIIVASLHEHGLKDDQIKYELFSGTQQGRVAQTADNRAESESGAVHYTLHLDGLARSFIVPDKTQSLLESALDQAVDAPFSCRGGVCSTCRAKVIEGEAEMLSNHALEDYEVRQGYVLTCQAYPRSDKVVFSYDE